MASLVYIQVYLCDCQVLKTVTTMLCQYYYALNHLLLKYPVKEFNKHL